jgi:hypothetical protein
MPRILIRCWSANTPIPTGLEMDAAPFAAELVDRFIHRPHCRLDEDDGVAGGGEEPGRAIAGMSANPSPDTNGEGAAGRDRFGSRPAHARRA